MLLVPVVFGRWLTCFDEWKVLGDLQYLKPRITNVS